MNKLLRAFLVIGAALTCASAAQAASPGYASATVNLRAGPGTHFPALSRIVGGSSVVIHGCTARYRWCDIDSPSGRGWVSAAYIQVDDRERRVFLPLYIREPHPVEITLVTFSVTSYWEDNYRDKSFYRDRNDWTDYQWEDESEPPGWDESWDTDPGQAERPEDDRPDEWAYPR